ncbi:MAG: hypothetical protein KDD56_09465, partial [Bdellovibrionales bacterium]|nr:hypothetical protein [Bdellovibrionales bacterium]
MNKQRQVIYNLRNTVLTNEGIREEVYSFIDDLVEETVLSVCQDNIKPADWNIESLSERVSFLFNQSSILNDDIELDQQKIFDLIRDKAKSLYDERVIKLQDKLNALKSVLESEDLETDNSEGNPFQIETIERNTILETIDHFWNLHLKEMDYLREGIGLRGYGQQNPLHAYQKEGFLLFQQMIDNLRESVVRKLFYFDVQEKEELISQIEEEKARREQKSKQMELHHDSALDSNDDQRSAAPVDPDSAKKKLAEQRKARRKKRR